MALTALIAWVGANDFTRADTAWCVKRLSANDTLASGSHQSGPYMPRAFMQRMFPRLNEQAGYNPDVSFELCVDSHDDRYDARAVWYNRKSRNEVRITRVGGAKSALRNADSTGALVVFSFRLSDTVAGRSCRVWVCDTADEEDLLFNTIGWVEPGAFCFAGHFEADSLAEGAIDCRLAPEEIPADWLCSFPDGGALLKKVIELRPLAGVNPDERLIRRRDCEYELFQSVEEAVAMPIVRSGFKTMVDFISYAQTTLQRRRVRSGRSLELHTRRIFFEEGLAENIDFAYGAESESKKRPDFLFPSKACYDDPQFPVRNLRMLAVKTTCRDRWRQVTTEADRIAVKHLLTLQEGVSERQFAQMADSGIKLVVPNRLRGSYPTGLRRKLTSVEEFIHEVRHLRPPADR